MLTSANFESIAYSARSHRFQAPVVLSNLARVYGRGFFASILLLLAVTFAGCGTGGYIGGGISSLSTAAITIDAGQSFAISSQESGQLPISWTLAGAKCSASSCGSLSANEGLMTIYTAPPGLTTQMQVTLTAAIAGTQSSKIVSITVNPDPAIAGTPPPGVVGVPYSATLTASGAWARVLLRRVSASTARRG